MDAGDVDEEEKFSLLSETFEGLLHRGTAKYRSKEAINVLYSSIVNNTDVNEFDDGYPWSVRPVLHKPVQMDGKNGRDEEDFLPENVGKCKFGGVPHLPKALAVLRDRKDFVAQFDCSVLSQFDLRGLIPAEGFIRVCDSLFDTDCNDFCVRHWAGPRSELTPSNSEIASASAKPVYYVTRFVPYSKEEPPEELEHLLGPLLFPRALDLGCAVLKKDPCVEACMTLFAIRKFCDSPLSAIPKDIVTMICKLLYGEAPVRGLDAWEHLRNKEFDLLNAHEDFFGLMLMENRFCCGYEIADFFSEIVISYESAKKGLWRKCQGFYHE